MPFAQSGADATAEIRGNYNDVHGDMINLVVHGNVTLPKQAHERRRVENTLDATIQTIQEIACLVSIDAANTILTDIAAILSLLQEYTENKDSLNALTRSCKGICSILAVITRGASMGRMSGSYWNAVEVLQLSIDKLRARLGSALPSRLIHGSVGGASLDLQEIRTCSAELEEISTSFSTKLNIVSVIRLEQIHELLQQNDATPNVIPDPPPPPPAVFFGREELLCKVKAALLRDEDIALIGPGGIGKSTLAMAVMNDEDIIQHYRRRFFVTYESLSQKTISFASFMDQIASVLGLPMSGVEGECQIKSNLSLSPGVLLVLDNAETFEDAEDRAETMRISIFIASVASLRGVTVVVTSRTSSNARRVSWTQFDVPPLERQPARLSFRELYRGEISDDEIDGLLIAVDFHPLSISILAYTARENRWSGKVVLARWNSQRGEILQMGDGKDDLGFTIRLSLESPSIRVLGDEALHVLWVIAFFPQGLNQDYLTRLFPSIPRISSIVDMFRKVSLIYPSGPFLTTLAPIRLFLLDALPTNGVELLVDVRRMYYRSLKAVSQDKDPHADLLVSDHLNIEHLISFDITHSLSDTRDIVLACRQFLTGLAWHKPRPTLLAPVISSLPEGNAVEKGTKAWYLDALGGLYYAFSNYSFSSTTYSTAHTLFVAVRGHMMAAGCASNAALSYNSLGKYSRARWILNVFVSSPSWQYVNERSKAEIFFTLDWSNMHLSSEDADKLFLRSTNNNQRGLASRVLHWQARMRHGYSTPEEVQNQLKALRHDCMSSPRVWHRWHFLSAAAEVAFLQRKLDVAMDVLNQAYESVNGDFGLSLIILTSKAAVATEQGDYDLSRSLSQHCIDTLGVVATSSSTSFLHVLFVQGRNELYAGNYLEARQHLTDGITHSDTCGEIEAKTSCMRALGEAEIFLGRKTDSDRCFAQTIELCKEAGTAPELLDVCDGVMRMDNNKFPGWKRFLATHTGQF